MTSGSLDQWLERLETLHPSEIELGLERVARVAGALDLLHPTQPVVSVAGTNGKGSTVAVLEGLLVRCGLRVGAYTSPHFLRFNERIRVSGEPVADAEIVQAFEQVEASRGETSLTYFEYATLAALLVFQARECDVLLLEVGLGGRLDAVNILDATVAVITSIALDHQQWLGDTREEIGCEKAGIARCGRPVVIADPDPPAAMLESVVATGAEPILRLGVDYDVVACGDGAWFAQLWRKGQGERCLPPMNTGSVLPENIAAAAQAALLLGVEVSDPVFVSAAQDVAVTGRRQRRRIDGKDYLLDVAHNPAAVDKLHEYIVSTHCNGKIFAVFSAMADKDLAGMLQPLSGVFDAWFLGELPGVQRAAEAAKLADLLRVQGETMISVSKNLRQALRRAQSLMSHGDLLVVFGSFHTVAAVTPALDRDAAK